MTINFFHKLYELFRLGNLGRAKDSNIPFPKEPVDFSKIEKKLSKFKSKKITSKQLKDILYDNN